MNNCEVLLEKEMETHSSIPAWKSPWTEEPGRLYSPWGHEELIANEHKHATKGKQFGKNSGISWKCQIIQAVIRETIRNLLDLLLFYILFCIFSQKTMSEFQWLKITEAYGLFVLHSHHGSASRNRGAWSGAGGILDHFVFTQGYRHKAGSRATVHWLLKFIFRLKVFLLCSRAIGQSKSHDSKEVNIGNSTMCMEGENPGYQETSSLAITVL